MGLLQTQNVHLWPVLEFFAKKLPKMHILSLRCLFTGVELEPLTASQSSTLAGDAHQFGAANCIDGESRDVDHGPDGIRSICHTNDEATPWIAIDYGTLVTVQRVEIFNRPGAAEYGSRTRNVDVRISDELPTSGSQMFSGGTLLGHFAGPGTDGQHIIVAGKRQL